MTYANVPSLADTYAAGIDDQSYADVGDGYFGRTSLTALGLTEAEIDAVLTSPLAAKTGDSITMENYMTWLMEAGYGSDDTGETGETEISDSSIVSSYETADDMAPDGLTTAADMPFSITALEDDGTGVETSGVGDAGLSPTMSGFGDDSPVTWRISDMDPVDPLFDTEFLPDNVTIRDDGSIEMQLLPMENGQYSFTGGEISSSEPVQYGRFEMRMRPSDEDGVISSIFTYTGPSEGNDHDEIDIEFLGDDTTKAQIGVFRDGEHEYEMIDLGFDASQGFNDYAFEWAPDSIKWYVNGDFVHEFNASDGYDIPSTPQRLFSNLWAVQPEFQDWAGLKDPTVAASMEIAGFSYTPL